MKHLKRYNESTDGRERIKTSDFIQEIRNLNDEEFESMCEDESPKYALSTALGNEYDSYFYNISLNYESFPYELVKIIVEKGDYKDEETTTGIFKRLSDGKHFSLIVHDGGFIGPDTISISEWMNEVRPRVITKTIWE